MSWLGYRLDGHTSLPFIIDLLVNRLAGILEHSQVVKTTDFDSVIAGSNPAAPISKNNDKNNKEV